MEIRERCVMVRKSNNLTQQAFADAIGVSVGVISCSNAPRYLRPKSAGISPHCSVSHLMMRLSY